MRSWRITSILLLTLVLGVIGFAGSAAAAGPLELYTPYTQLSASPGQTVNYTIELINNTSEIQKVGVSVRSMPADWEYELTSGGFGVSEVAVKPGDSQELRLSVDVPLAVQKGTYTFTVVTDRDVSLPLSINIAEAGTFRTELTTDQPNLEGSSDAKFTYTVKLDNKTAEEQTYALRHGAPAGWDVVFKSSAKNVSSVVLEPNSSQNITVDVTPAANVKAEKYVIPIEAASANTGDSLQLEAVITGTFDMILTTDNELLSAEVTAGSEKKINLVLRNTGSSDLRGIKLTSTRPSNWEVEFEEDENIMIPAGESKTVTATIKASDKAIAGDYVVGINAGSAEISKSTSIRVSVKASVLWGWLGILIIAAVFIGIFYLFRKYGRR